MCTILCILYFYVQYFYVRDAFVRVFTRFLSILVFYVFRAGVYERGGDAKKGGISIWAI